MALIKWARKDDAKAEQVRKEQDDLLQTMAGLCIECNSARQECDDSRGQVNDLLGEVEKERDLTRTSLSGLPWRSLGTRQRSIP
jgi:hypothetical protein